MLGIEDTGEALSAAASAASFKPVSMLSVAIATSDVIGLVMTSSVDVDVLGLARRLLLLLQKRTMEPPTAIVKKALAPQAITTVVKDVRYMGICDTASSSIRGDDGGKFGGVGNGGVGGTGGGICGDGGLTDGGSVGGNGGRAGGRGEGTIGGDGGLGQVTWIPLRQSSPSQCPGTRGDDSGHCAVVTPDAAKASSLL